MNESNPKELQKAQSIQTLSFLRGKNWLDGFISHLSTNKEKKEVFTNKLVNAGMGIGECMDERPSLTRKELQSNLEYFSTRNLEKPKPAMVGGAAGWTTYFILTGQTVDQAIQSTRSLYKQMGWDEMQIHIDDEHKGIKNIEELKKRLKGCGFLGVINEVVSITQDLLKDEGIVGETIPQINSEEIIKGLIDEGAKVVPLTGNHKNKGFEAQVIINNVNEKTLSRDSIYDENPAFLWDKWATTNQAVLAVFNSLAGKSFNQEQFIKLQATVHLATGLMLDAIKFGEDGNILMLSS